MRPDTFIERSAALPDGCLATFAIGLRISDWGDGPEAEVVSVEMDRWTDEEGDEGTVPEAVLRYGALTVADATVAMQTRMWREEITPDELAVAA